MRKSTFICGNDNEITYNKVVKQSGSKSTGILFYLEENSGPMTGNKFNYNDITSPVSFGISSYNNNLQVSSTEIIGNRIRATPQGTASIQMPKLYNSRVEDNVVRRTIDVSGSGNTIRNNQENVPDSV